MTKTITATQARKNLFNLISEAGLAGVRVRITLGDKPPVIMLSEEELDGWLETFDIMSDPDLVKGIKEGGRDAKAGRTITLDKLKKKYKV